MTIEQIHDYMDHYLDFIFYRKKLNNCARNKIICASDVIDEFSLNTAT